MILDAEKVSKNNKNRSTFEIDERNNASFIPDPDYSGDSDSDVESENDSDDLDDTDSSDN